MSTADTDWSLARQVREGRDTAFDELMHRHSRPVIRFIYRMIGNAGEAEDVAQDVFVRAYRAMCKPSFKEGPGQFSTWLFQVARNAAIDWLRRRKSRPAESLSGLQDEGAQFPGPGRTADQEVIGDETARAVATAVAALPDAQREVLILSEYHGLSCGEAAEVLNASEKSVETRLYRARQTLRDRLRNLLG